MQALSTMDFNSLKEAAANLSIYDLKAGVRKVQNGRITVLASCQLAHAYQP
jgi:hypothetical protein